MAFDFDEIEEGFCLPPELSGVEAMPDEAFGRFGERLRRAERLGRYEDLDQAMAEALWDEDAVAQRVGTVLKELLALLQEIAKSKKEAKYVDRSGFAVMHALFAFSVSCSQHEVRVRPGKAEAADCALILGFGGSHIDELEGQAEFYHSSGFTTISMSACSGPPLLKAKQKARVGHELRTALKGGRKLHVHICSNFGFMRWIELMHEWNEGFVPLDSLPPLRQCLASLVVECAPMCPLNPYTGEVLALPGSVLAPKMPEAEERTETKKPAPEPQATAAPDAAATSGSTEATLTADQEGDRTFLVVMIGCITANFKRWAPEAEWSRILYAEKKFMFFLRGAAQNGAFWLAEEVARRERSRKLELPEGVSLGSDQGKFLPGSGFGIHNSELFILWEHMDLAIQPPPPRLFLYTAEDKLILARFSEAYAKHTAKYNPKARVLEKRCLVSEHCRLWDTEREACAAAVGELLALAGLS